MAAENYLWGAPRIHGELLTLGLAISERTVSRYLSGRPKDPVANLADILREPRWWSDICLAVDVRGCGQ